MQIDKNMLFARHNRFYALHRRAYHTNGVQSDAGVPGVRMESQGTSFHFALRTGFPFQILKNLGRLVCQEFLDNQ